MTQIDLSINKSKVVLITGMSGAGKSSALKSLEDMGYEAIDNVPISMIPKLVAPSDDKVPIAIGTDVRTRDFNANKFLQNVKRIGKYPGLSVRILFIDCKSDVLIRRFGETRRKHPLAADQSIADSLKLERNRLALLRRNANMIIDTSEMHTRALKQLLQERFSLVSQPSLTICLASFGFKSGLPCNADLVFDVRFLINPYYEQTLRQYTGQDSKVGYYIEQDKDLNPFFNNLTALLGPLIPRYAAEGKSNLTIAIGCTGGQHRSVYVSERLGRWLAREGHFVQISHRDLEMRDK